MWRQNAKKMIVQIEQKSTDANERERLVNGIKKYQEKLNPESQ